MRLFHTCVAAVVLIVGLAPYANAQELSRLADAFVAEVVRVAHDRPVQVAVPEDRSGRGATVALDVHALVLERLTDRLKLVDAGSRRRFEPVLSESTDRLVLSARVVDEPEGHLVDWVSASVKLPPGVVSLAPTAPTPARGLVALGRTSLSAPVEGPLLAIAWLGDDDLVLLSGDSASWHHVEAGQLRERARHALKTQGLPVRTPGGVLVPATLGVWAATSRSGPALLLQRDGEELRADTEQPWLPAARGRLRFRAGTNLLDGDLGPLGAGPFLAVSADGQAVVDSDGRLRVASGGRVLAGPRVGSAVDRVQDGLWVTSSASPPGESDALVFVARVQTGLRTVDQVPLAGTVRAIAVRRIGSAFRVAAALETGRGTQVVITDLQVP